MEKIGLREGLTTVEPGRKRNVHRIQDKAWGRKEIRTGEETQTDRGGPLPGGCCALEMNGRIALPYFAGAAG